MITRTIRLEVLFVFLVTSLSVLVLVVGCSGVESKIVGKWQPVFGDSFIEYEFFSDGTVNVFDRPRTHPGKWVVLDDGRIKVTTSRNPIEYIFRQEQSSEGGYILVLEGNTDFRLERVL